MLWCDGLMHVTQDAHKLLFILLQVPIYIMHHLEKYYDDPFVFNPSRFDSDQKRYDSLYLYCRPHTNS